MWYLILMPFAKLGFPYITTNIISWIINSVAVWLILDKAPCKFYKRVLLIFMAPLFYVFPIVSRCYCLIPLAVVLMAITYKKRKEKPLAHLLSIVLLANTHLIMLSLVGLCLLDYFVELCKDIKLKKSNNIKNRVICLIIAGLLLFVSMLPLLNCLNANQDMGKSNNIVSETPTSMIQDRIYYIKELFNATIPFIIVCSVALLVSLIALILDTRKDLYTFVEIILNVLWQAFIMIFVFFVSPHRIASIVFVLLYYKWINAYKDNKIPNNKAAEIIWNTIVGSVCVATVVFLAFQEIPYDYSSAYQMGDYINANLEDGSIIANGSRTEYTSSVIPYINKDIKFYHIASKRYFTYAIWDNLNKKDITLEEKNSLSDAFEDNQKLYYIFCPGKYSINEYNHNNEEKEVIEECVKKGIFKEIYATDDRILYDENYILYEINN